MADDLSGKSAGAHFYNQVFDSHKYKKNDIGRRKDVPYADGSDALANEKKLYISFLHVPSNSSVFFKAFITAYNETYTSNWQSEEVFGRADPIHNFKQTTRDIQLSFVVPAASESEAYENLAKVQNLIQYLYPTYARVQEAQTITQGPLVRLKIMNLLENKSNAVTTAPQTSFKDLKEKSKYYSEYKSRGAYPDHGQLGFISNLTVNHNLENKESGVFEKVGAQNTILPKSIEIVISFTPIHEHPLGWEAGAENPKFSPKTTKSPSGEGFPYGTSLYDARDFKNGADGKTWAAAEKKFNTPPPGRSTEEAKKKEKKKKNRTPDQQRQADEARLHSAIQELGGDMPDQFNIVSDGRMAAGSGRTERSQTTSRWQYTDYQGRTTHYQTEAQMRAAVAAMSVPDPLAGSGTGEPTDY